MRVLVTGAAGFVGRYLLRELQLAGHTVVALDMRVPPAGAAADPAVCWRSVDLLDAGAVAALVARSMPEAMIHLAALASVPQSAADPHRAYRVNAGGTLHLLRAFGRHAPAARLLVVSSAQVYGNRSRPAPVQESALLEPDNPYAESKAWADLLARLYAGCRGMTVMTVRPHNHTGPGQSTTYAVPAFAAAVADVVRGRARLPLAVGNLDSRRDLGDVRDVVRAYRLLLEHGRAGQAYNLATGRLIAMREVLETFCALAAITSDVRIDPDRWRPTDASPLLDTRALREATGWEPRFTLEQTLGDVWNVTLKPNAQTGRTGI